MSGPKSNPTPNSNLLLSLQGKRESLKPTQTVVRTIPIISDGWEEAAVGDQPEEFRPENKRPYNDQSLNEWKEKLKPTATVVKSIPSVFTCEPSVADEVPVEQLETDDWKDAHGFLGNPDWNLPCMTKRCMQEARPGYTSKMAHEYEDLPEVLLPKVKLLANLVTRSKNCMIYSGAGLSTSSGINDYATKARDNEEDSRPVLRSPLQAQPTLAHRVLVEMYKANLVHYWVQQNHDGLPQKAGLPQHAINEIHGAWFDCSNPVVAMSGNLRSDLFEEMLEWEERADLTISLGSSMCGMNSDRCFITPAKKSKIGTAIGGVIISIQQTQFDHLSCLRIFAPIDKVMKMLLLELDLTIPTTSPSLQSSRISKQINLAIPENWLIDKYTPDVTSGKTSEEDVFTVPYNQKGYLLTAITTESYGDNIASPLSTKTTLNLQIGSKVILTQGPHAGDEGEVIGKNLEGHYRIQFSHLLSKKTGVRRPFESLLGSWWVQAAVQGTVARLPVYNVIQRGAS